VARQRAGSARRYAEALFSLALERGTLDDWGAQLQRIATVVEDPVAQRVLAGPTGSVDAKRRALEALAGPLSREVMTLVGIMLERKRVQLFPGLAAAFAARLREHRGVELANVTTAIEMGDAERNLVAERVARQIGKRVELRTTVDPEIIGGVVVRVGDQLFDASVRGKLEALRRVLSSQPSANRSSSSA
jgi:F-type H+-transporting ATPase subunit delta